MVPLDLSAEIAPGPHDPDRRPARLGEMLPPSARSEVGLGAEFGRVNAAESQLWAYRVELIVELATRRPAARDRRPGTPGAAAPAWAGPETLPDGVSEFVPDEVALLMNCSRAEATTLVCVAWMLHQRLPDTLAALADGKLSWSRARAIALEIHRAGSELDPHAAATVEAVVLPQAADLPVKRLRAVVRRELLRFDADAEERRRRQARAAAGVFLRRTARDGVSEVVIVLPHAVGAAMVGAVDAHAREAKAADDPRLIGVIRAEVAANLILRPWDESHPPVSPQLRILAPINSLLPDPADPAAGGPPPGIAEVDGEPVTAAHLRALLEAVDAMCPGGLQTPTGGNLFFDLLGAGGGLLATLTRAELEAAARRGCPQHPAGDCACALVGRPPPTTAYEPTERQRRYLSARDHGCRLPGCSNRTGWADLDHVHPHAEGGATDCDNLCCLCRRHHRLKTHAHGWSFHLDADGALLVTTPTGVTRVSRPPGSYFMEPYEFGEPLPEAGLYDLVPF
jgi:hypothetical protein